MDSVTVGLLTSERTRHSAIVVTESGGHTAPRLGDPGSMHKDPTRKRKRRTQDHHGGKLRFFIQSDGPIMG